MDQNIQQSGTSTSTFPPLERNAGNAIPSTAPRPKKFRLIIVIATLILVIIAIAGSTFAFVTGWNPFQRSLSPEQVINNMLDRVLDIKSAEYEFKLAFKSEAREPNAVPWAAELPEFQERKEATKRDRERLSDISFLQFAIRSYFEKHGRDPLTLDQLTSENRSAADHIHDPKTEQLYGYRQEAGGANFVLHIQMETDVAIGNYTKAFEDEKKGAPIVRSNRVIEVTKDTPAVYASVDFSDVSPYPISFNFDELYQYLPVELDAVLELAGQNESDVSKLNDAAYSATAQVALGGTTFNAGAELRKKGEEYYLKINEAPSLGFFDLAALKQKWIKAVPQDAYGTFLGNVLYRSGEESIDERSARVLRQYQMILQLLQDNKVLQVVQEFPRVKEGDSSLYHYQVKLDRSKFATFYRRLTETMEKEFGDKAIIEFNEKTLQYLESEEFTRFYEALDKNVVLELWVDDENFWPRRFAYTVRLVPPGSVPKLKDKQYRFALTLGLDKVNHPVAVEAPTGAISVDEARVLLTGESIEEVKLSRQRSQVEAIRDALTTYKAHTGNYPSNLSELLKTISEVPAGPPQPKDADTLALGTYRLDQLKKDNNHFLDVIPQDAYTNQPYVYTTSGASFELKYTMHLPPKQPDALSDYRYDYNLRSFVEGNNTATPDELSVEASANDASKTIPSSTSSGSSNPLTALSDAREKANAARIKSNVSQLRTLAEVYYDSNSASYQGFDQCVTAPSATTCSGEMASSIVALQSDLANAYGRSALSVNATQNQFCISHPLPDNKYSCIDASGTFVESSTATCGTTATTCPK